MGSNCKFAHSESEIRGAPDLSKTQLCVKFMNGRCFKDTCTYAHGEAELKKPPNFKKKICAWYRDGKCRNGDNCGFAHTLAEIQANVDPLGAGPGSSEKSLPPMFKAERTEDIGDTSTNVPSSQSMSEFDSE